VPRFPELTGRVRRGKSAWRNLREAIALILEHRREETLRGVPSDATREIVFVG